MLELNAYLAAAGSVAYAHLGDYGWLRLSGRDRLELLHRLSTNDAKTLAPGAGAPTVLTNPNGRVIALTFVYSGAGEAFLRLQPGQAAAVLAYVQSMIFWQDEVTPSDESARVAQFALYGPGAAGLIAELTGADPAGLEPYGWLSADLASVPVRICRGGPLEPWAYTLVAPVGHAAAVAAALGRRAPALSPAEADLHRIEKGLPLWGRELSGEVTPLETGLQPAINFKKGCYTGQEVIARQVNYEKITRELAGLVFPAGADFSRDGPAPLAAVRGPGRGGFVGSAAHSPRLDRTIALAVVPRDLAVPGSTVTVVRGEHTWEAEVHSLPFISE